MRSETRRRKVAVRLFLWSWLLWLTTASAALAAELPADIVALTGREVPQLLGLPLADVSATAIDAGSPTAVHVQIDQRTRGPDGRWQYVFDADDTSVTTATRGLGADDLVLLAADEGGERLPSPPTHTAEIEVVGAEGNSRWFYLGRGAPAALPPLLSYDPVADRVRGSDYLLGFSHNGTPVIDTLILGDPQHAANILDRSKARLDVDLALGMGHIARSEDDVRIRTTGLHSGPLRIIRECEVRGRMLFGVYSPPVRDNFVFYAHGFVLPTTVRLTPTARFLTRSVTLRISMDLRDAGGELAFQSAPEISSPLAIDGHGGTRGGSQPIVWYLLRDGTTGLLGWLEAPDDIARDVTVYYRDDRTHTDAPERSPGEVGDHGFLYRHRGGLPAGDLRLSTHAWILHGTQLEQPAAELHALGSRPTVHVH